MVQRAFVGAADIHARALAHRLQAFKDLDVLGGIAARLLRRRIGGFREQIGGFLFGCLRHFDQFLLWLN
jgi:hypothetical protein